MATVSLCMIVRNEEDVLGRCLESVKDIVDEIIIVDTGSTDRTKEIAGRFRRGCGKMIVLFATAFFFYFFYAIFPFQKQLWIIRCGWMRMT